MEATSLTLLGRLHSNYDDVAWTHFVTMYSPWLKKRLKPILPPATNSDDLIQAVFIVVSRRIREFDHNGNAGAFRTWLRAICWNVAQQHLRRERRSPFVYDQNDLDSLFAPDSPLSLAWEREHDAYVIRCVLDSLRKEFGEATYLGFHAVVVDGKSVEEAAALLNTTPNAIRIAKHKVLKRAREESSGLIGQMSIRGNDRLARCDTFSVPSERIRCGDQANASDWRSSRDELLNRLARGKLAEDDAQRLAEHLETCQQCCDKVDHVAPDELARFVRAAVQEEPTKPQNFPPELAEDDRYHFVRNVSSGGMGNVFEAVHHFTGQRVAIKVLHAHLAHDLNSVQRFTREAAILGQLEHPNIVRMVDGGWAGPLPFLVTEFLAGSSLQEVANGKGLPISEACCYITQAAAGLQYGHTRGVIHRDVKPQNLLLNATGQVKIIDYGIARWTQSPSRNLDAGQTTDGQFLGSAAFVAPEQVLRAGSVGPQADVYGLGCTFYQLLTGQVPFPAESVSESLLRHAIENPPSIRNVRPDLPTGLEAVIHRMMAKDLPQRFATMLDVIEALSRFTQAQPTSSRFTGSRRWFLGVTLGFALGGIGGLAWQATNKVPKTSGDFIVGGSDADFATLETAVQKCPPGSRLRLNPGVYQVAALILEQDIELIGEGPDTTTIEVSTAVGIVCNAPRVQLRGLTLQSRTGGTVAVKSGTLVVENCVISRVEGSLQPGPCVSVNGSGSFLVMSKCKIQATPSMEGCG